jgi:hypothetical protein
MFFLFFLAANPAFALTPSEELKRQRLVAEELNKYEHRVLVYDASSLSENDKAFLKLMLNAAKVVEEINMLQLNPENLVFQAQIKKDGTIDDEKLFHRNQCPWCLDSDEYLCNALKSLSAKQIGWGFWPEDMKEETLKELQKQPDADELLSPFTYVVKDKKGQYKAVPFVSSPVIAERVRKLASLLREAALLTEEKSLKKFLKSRARALEDDSAFPYDDSDLDWIGLSGPWEITVGPYETYKEPMKTKAQFEMYIAREDTEVGKRLFVFQNRLQDFENHLAGLIGKDLYTPRKLNPAIKIRAVELIMAAGDGRSPHGATVAYHLPNRGKAVEKGLYKKVLLVNHMKLFTPLMQKRAKLILAREQIPLVEESSDIMNTLFHELAHGFGPHEDMEITPAGKKTTVAMALGPMETLMEELKADVASLWFVPYLEEKGLMKKDDVKKRYATAVMHLLGLAQYSLKGTYAQMAAVELGNLMDKGALAFNKITGRFQINFDRFPPAVESLLKEIIMIQAKGDKTGAELLRAKYVRKLSDERYVFETGIIVPMEKVKNTFDRAGLKSFAIDYEVKGL